MKESIKVRLRRLGFSQDFTYEGMAAAIDELEEWRSGKRYTNITIEAAASIAAHDQAAGDAIRRIIRDAYGDDPAPPKACKVDSTPDSVKLSLAEIHDGSERPEKDTPDWGTCSHCGAPRQFNHYWNGDPVCMTCMQRATGDGRTSSVRSSCTATVTASRCWPRRAPPADVSSVGM